jgi:hypothetical protein
MQRKIFFIWGFDIYIYIYLAMILAICIFFTYKLSVSSEVADNSSCFLFNLIIKENVVD